MIIKFRRAPLTDYLNLRIDLDLAIDVILELIISSFRGFAPLTKFFLAMTSDIFPPDRGVEAQPRKNILVAKE